MPRVSKDEQLLINEVRKYERALNKETARAKSLAYRASFLGNEPLLKRRPKAYQMVFKIVPGDLTALTQTLSISEGRGFEFHSISTSFAVVAQAAVDTDGAGTLGPGQIINISAGYSGTNINGPSNRQAFFDFFWRLRDSNGDLDFQDIEQPSVALCSGHASPLVLPVPARLNAGAQLSMDIVPFANISTEVFAGSAISGVFDVRNYSLVVKFWGEEIQP